MLEKGLAILAGVSYVGAIYYGRRPDIKRRDRNDPRVIANRFKRIAMVCLVWTVVTPLVSHYSITMAFRSMGMVPGVTFNHSFWRDILDVFRVIRIMGALYLGSIFAYLFESKLDMATFIDDIYINFFTLQGYRDHVFAPLTEEVIYRSVILTLLSDCSARVMYASPLLFGLAHIHHGYELKRKNPKIPITLVVMNSAFQLIYTTLFGMLATFIFRKFNHNLWTSVVAHFMCNLLQFPPVGVEGPLYANIIYYILSVWGIARFFLLLRAN
ncbi:CAAX prenyl protease 2 [Diutina catenulata]